MHIYTPLNYGGINMKLISVIATYRQMNLQDLELWNSIHDDYLNKILKENANEYIILKTCNRFEIYAILKENGKVKNLLDLGPNGKILEGTEVIKHIIEVSSGMDSMIPGEQDIQRQVKEALENSIKKGTSGKLLNYLFMRAINVSKEIRSKTKISNGIVSLPQASVKIVESILNSGKVAILGTGRVANTLLKYLPEKYQVDVFGRNVNKMKIIERSYNVKTYDINKIKENMENYDAIFSALRMDGIILSKDDFLSKKPTIIVDLGNPRNVENPGNRYFIDLEYLKEYVSKNISIRILEMEKAKKIIDMKLKGIEKKLWNYDVEELIASIYKRAEKIKEEEINELMKYLDSNEMDKIEKFANSMIKKMYDKMVENLRKSEYDINLIEKLKEILG